MLCALTPPVYGYVDARLIPPISLIAKYAVLAEPPLQPLFPYSGVLEQSNMFCLLKTTRFLYLIAYCPSKTPAWGITNKSRHWFRIEVSQITEMSNMLLYVQQRKTNTIRNCLGSQPRSQRLYRSSWKRLEGSLSVMRQCSCERYLSFLYVLVRVYLLLIRSSDLSRSKMINELFYYEFIRKRLLELSSPIKISRLLR